MSKLLRWTPALVRAGAGGGIGAEFVARSPADGYTVLMSIAGTITIQPHLIAKKTYDPLKDLAPVTRLVTFPFVLVANPSVPARNARDVIALAKARPGRVNFATSGIGTDYHLATELFKSLALVDIVPVPYKGGAPSMTAIIAGEADIGFQVISTALRERLTDEGFEIVLTAPAPFAEFLREDSARWARVVREAKIALE